ncbi:NUDIX domain-containing protein [Chitinophaga arvensicola]|uniref:Predicted NTP pyrophosphohydrolase, NUDIX family n=1 Tax=Chitinophaga arvensicola TaxID=29529 RepID=A0A1I0S6E4_9BACT|nr:NUDIX domain-containing protein [Chitinophaga arvensicola]SEW51066.1 Predicted NTP pyrophosphohydrolase, NUDIX family [Chitinophaga arvensicola]
MKQSAGILLIRYVHDTPEFFLVHPGGPFFARKDAGWWTVPKGELMPGEEPLAAAIREFEEETGYQPVGPFTPLTPVVQKGGKQVLCWAATGAPDPEKITSNTFEIEWPPKSGKRKTYPEVDKAGWFTYDAAKLLLNQKQVAFLDEALQLHRAT